MKRLLEIGIAIMSLPMILIALTLGKKVEIEVTRDVVDEPDITVKTLISDWLEAYGYDGLAGEDCGCGLDDLMCCDLDCTNIGSCVPAYKVKCTEDYCQTCCGRGEFSVCDGDWKWTKTHFSPQKPPLKNRCT